MSESDDPFQEVDELRQAAERLLGLRDWLLLSCYGRLTTGPHAGSHINIRPFVEQLELVHRLYHGETVPVHLMHRHCFGEEEVSSLRWTMDGFVMVLCDREVPAKQYEPRPPKAVARESDDILQGQSAQHRAARQNPV